MKLTLKLDCQDISLLVSLKVKENDGLGNGSVLWYQSQHPAENRPNE